METWLPVVGYEDLYEVSDLGQVRSLDRVVMTRNRWGNLARRHYKGRILRQHAGPGTKGYPFVALCRDGAAANYPVHILVLAAHVGPRPAGQEARHGPTGKADASLANLCWGTRVENIADRLRDGQDNRGERHSGAKLTWAAVEDMRKQWDALMARPHHFWDGGALRESLARQYGVTASNVWMVCRRKTWIR